MRPIQSELIFQDYPLRDAIPKEYFSCNSSFDVEENLPKCEACSKRGKKKMVTCYECDSTFHIACANPVIKTKHPKNTWTCSGCKGKKSKGLNMKHG